MPEDVEWFDQALAKLVEEELIEEHQNIVDYGLDRYFVDFLRDAPEATGTANQKKNHSIFNTHRNYSFIFILWSM